MYKDMTLEKFILDISSSSPAPGGGSVSALGGAFGAGLLEMAVRISEKSIPEESFLHYISKLTDFREHCMQLIDEDSAAFTSVMEAYRLPRKTEEEKKKRSKKIQEALRTATETPLKTAESCLAIMNLAEEIISVSKESCLSDAACGYYFAEGGLKGALANVAINLGSLSDEEFIGTMREKMSALSNWHRSNSPKIEGMIKEKMGL